MSINFFIQEIFLLHLASAHKYNDTM